MRERITELAVQAGFDFDSKDCNFYPPSDSAQWINKQVYGLSESIINDCLQLLESMKNSGISVDKYPELIKAHFGIK